MNFQYILSMKTVFKWAVFLLSFQIYSQSGTIKYSNKATLKTYFKRLKVNDLLTYKKYEQFAEYEKEMMSQINYELSFSNDKSIFKPIIKGHEHKLLLKTKQTEGIYYRDSVLNYFYISRRFKNYNVEIAPVSWEITPVSKNILGYRCYKAYGTKNVYDTKNPDLKIVAWFTNKINLKHGPRGINGLPGLILEAHYDNYHFYAEEVDLNSKGIISKPNKGKNISEFDFYKQMQEPTKQ